MVECLSNSARLEVSISGAKINTIGMASFSPLGGRRRGAGTDSRG